jgi:hypothetical protein
MKISRSVALIAPTAGFLLGFLDFVWIKYVPFPFGGLGNSIAVWAVAAFLLTYFSRWPLPHATLGAIIFLVAAVPSYYTAAALIQNDDWSNLYALPSLLWMALAVVAGALFGTGGAVARTPSRWQIPASALPPAILFAEATLQLARLTTRTAKLPETLAYAALLTALALGITLAIAPPWRPRALTLAYALPLTAVGYLMLLATGFR